MENNTNQSAVVGLKIENGGEVFNDYENNTASGRNSHAEGEDTEASAIAAHSEGSESKAMQIAAHAEGYSFAAGHGSHAENGSVAEGDYSHSEGYLTKTMSANSHSENAYTIAAAQSSHAEGDLTLTEGIASHSEGLSSESVGHKSHAEGTRAKATGDGSHAEGETTEASGADSHAEGKNTRAVGARSFAGGNSTVAAADNQTVIGAFNLNHTDTLFEVGNGASDTERSNAFEVYSDGSVALGGEKISPSQLQTLIDMLPTLGTNTETAMWLQAGKPILDTVESGSDERWFEFVPSETGKHVIYSEGNINIKATLYDSALTPLASDTSGGWGYNFRIYENLTVGEKYYICVQSENGSTGSYYMNANALSIMQAGASSEAAVTITEFNKGIEKEYNNANGQIWHRFTANAAEAHVDGKTGEYIISIACDGILSGNLYNSKMEVVWGHDIFQYSNSFFAGYELAYGEEYYFCSEVSAMPIEHNIAINYTRDSSYCAGTEDDPFIIKNIYEPVTATISTPGEEKWFKFRVEGQYEKIVVHSLFSTALIAGDLFDISKNLIKKSDIYMPEDGHYEPHLNFNIEHTCLSGETFYLRVTARDNKTGSFKIRWTDELVAESIKIQKEDLFIKKNETCQLSASITPDNAFVTDVIWETSNSNIVEVSQTGLVTAKNVGVATVKVRVPGTDLVDICQVSVYQPLKTLKFNEPEISIFAGTIADTGLSFLPKDATNKSVKWIIEDESVLSIKDNKIQGLSAGTTTLKAVSTTDEKISASCTVRVLENVVIRKDSYSYNLEFENGLIWKHVGVDLVNDEWNGTSEDAARSEYNRSQAFSEKQLAYIYLFDPLGLEHYMTMYGQDHDMEHGDRELLYFKDRVFEKIFGQKPRLFKIVPSVEDTNIIYFEYKMLTETEQKRVDYYSDAEVIFGAHKVLDNITLDLFLFKLFPYYFLSGDPLFFTGLNGIEKIKLLYYSGAINDFATEEALSYLEEYLKSATGLAPLSIFGWYKTIISTVITITDLLTPPNLKDVEIYNKVAEQEFVAHCILEDGSDVTLKRLIDNNLYIC